MKTDTKRTPVVFIHGLWLLPSSWDRWAELFRNEGFEPHMPGWPDDPETVAEANSHPDAFARKSIGQIADHFEKFIRALDAAPVVVGHSFGGLIAQILAGRGLASSTVALSPAPFRGVLPLPFSALKSAWPILGNPANRNRAVPLTFDQFHYAFANAVSEAEAKDLYERYAVPAGGKPLFQSAAANLNPWTEAQVDTHNPKRGPMLLVCGDKDHTVPPAIVNATFKLQKANPGVTELATFANRGHSITIDSGWKEVGEKTVEFARRDAAVHATAG